MRIDPMDDVSSVNDGLLAHGLLSAVCAALNAGALDPHLTEMLRETFRRRMPTVDVADDRVLGVAVEDLAIRFRIRGQGL